MDNKILTMPRPAAKKTGEKSERRKRSLFSRRPGPRRKTIEELHDEITDMCSRLPLGSAAHVDARLGKPADIPIPDRLAVFLNHMETKHRTGYEPVEFEDCDAYNEALRSFRAYLSHCLFGHAESYYELTSGNPALSEYPGTGALAWVELGKVHRFLKRVLKDYGTEPQERTTYGLAQEGEEEAYIRFYEEKCVRTEEAILGEETSDEFAAVLVGAPVVPDEVF
jgi:hypothetical protein